MDFAIVGAGLTGAVLAQELARLGHTITVYDMRNHIAGNCYTERDQATGVLLHKYGPHIFHTDNKHVWDYVNKFTEFMPYINRVKVTTKKQVFSLPMNLHTINQYFKKTFNPAEAEFFIKSLSKTNIKQPRNFKEQALKIVGECLYQDFFEGYTVKQWGLSPDKIPASILKRLPIRFNYDDNYYDHKYQGIPKNGYTPMVDKMLDHENIKLELSAVFKAEQSISFDHVFYTGAIDAWFKYTEGRLPYRTLEFAREESVGDYQGCAVMNYAEENIPYTRIVEHKHFAPWETHNKTVVFKEYSRDCKDDDIPYYPVHLVDDKLMLNSYIAKAKSLNKVSFLGRLGTYRYLDMDVTIAEALMAAEKVDIAIRTKNKIPVFFFENI